MKKDLEILIEKEGLNKKELENKINAPKLS